MSDRETGRKSTSGALRAPALGLLLALSCITVSPSLGQDVCDNRIEGEKGEKPGPFFGFGLVLYTYTLAEKVCGADITSLRSQTLEAAQRAGCGPGTEMYTSLDDYFGKMDELDLRALAEDGRTGPPMSDDEVRVWAQTVVDELGGCEALLGFVDETQNGTSER